MDGLGRARADLVAGDVRKERDRLKWLVATYPHDQEVRTLRDEVSVHVVAKRLGLKDPWVTLNVYADAMTDDDGRAVDTLTKAVWGA